VGLAPVPLIPSVSTPLTWPLVEPGALSHGERRKSQTQAPLPTRSTDGTLPDDRAAGRSFFPLPAVTALGLDTSTLSRPWSRPLPLRRFTICASARWYSPLYNPWRWNHHACGLTSGFASRRLPFGHGSDTAFSAAVLAGTAGWRHLLRPGGTALLSFPATRDPPGFRSLPKRLAIIGPGRRANLFRLPQKKRSLAWGAGTICFILLFHYSVSS
jgi:hypothetical protein